MKQEKNRTRPSGIQSIHLKDTGRKKNFSISLVSIILIKVIIARLESNEQTRMRGN